ncbi:MAG TPA: tRNA lysidine(34) synthetase TilS [Pirellulales bacterium]|nr:tRNA lysidine(34) synthetase TilS [Pirellulales bacterium]
MRTVWPPEQWHDVTVMVAVSGGADSVALLRAMHAICAPGPGRIVVAHFNHAWRPEADADEAFVAELAKTLGLQCQTGRSRRTQNSAESYPATEESARHERYDFLRERAAQVGARYVATGHTADDQAETVLHRIVRGTGIAGLGGMRRARPLSEGTTLIRPLLHVRRTELAAYLQSIEQSHREDATNAERRFTRNRLRQELIPELAAEYNPHVVDALLRLSQLAHEAQQVIDAQAAILLRRAVVFETDRAMFDVQQLLAEPRPLVRETFVAAWRRQGWPEQAMGFAEWDGLADLVLCIDAGAGPQRVLPGGVFVRRDEKGITLERK